MTDDNEMEVFIRDAFETNYEMLRSEGAGALSPHTRANALRQVLVYWRKMRDVAEHVTDTEVRLSLPGQETPQGREFGIEGIVDIVQDEDRTVMYDIKTHDADEVRAHREDYEKQLNVYAHIWQTLRNQPLDQTAVIATNYPESVRMALNAADDEMLGLALQHWDPLVPIPFDQRTVHATIRAFGEVIDAIEDGQFAPPPVEVLQERLPGTRWRFATRVCRNCDARFSCISYREYAWPSRGAGAEAQISQYYHDVAVDAEQEDWRSASLEATPDAADLQADFA